MTTTKFQKIIWDYSHAYERDLPWRETKDPYKIFVSEVMLQQTQVSRVLRKYPEFIKKFPSFRALAKASLRTILHAWQGMGYNRRALYLKRSAEVIVNEYAGKLPSNQKLLEQLPGIGKATAASIAAFAYNAPVIFIETNIRRVFIYFFFKNKREIHDHDVLKLVEKTLNQKNPREWYWTLMDYGAMLKVTEDKNPNRKSIHYKKQSKFEGSRRQLRGKIIKLLLQGQFSFSEISRHISSVSKDNARACVKVLVREKLIKKQGNKYTIV